MARSEHQSKKFCTIPLHPAELAELLETLRAAQSFILDRSKSLRRESCVLEALDTAIETLKEED